MAITYQDLLPSTLVSDIPSIVNANFSLTKQHIDDIEQLLGTNTKTLKLTNLTTIPNDSIECSTLTLTGQSGVVLLLSPNGGTPTLSLTFDGILSLKKIEATGTGSDKSIIAEADVQKLNAGDTSVAGDFNLNDPLASFSQKYEVVPIVDANIGQSATNPVDISKAQIVYLDYYNGGNNLAGSSEVNLDISNLKDGQIIKLVCFRSNGNGMRLYNGQTNAEIFAYIDPSQGYVSVSSTVYPEFAPQASPNNQSWLLVQWQNIGGGNYRLVVLDSKNVNNVN